MNINWDSIMAKAQKRMESSDKKREIQKRTDDYMLSGRFDGPRPTWNVEDAAYKFVNVLLHAIYREGLPANVEALLERIEVGTPFKWSDGKYKIYVYFENDLDRSSMSTKKDYYDINLAKLYNDGVDHVMKQIFETDPNGILRVSSSVIPFTGFIEQAVDDFMGNYSTEYNVQNIEILQN